MLCNGGGSLFIIDDEIVRRTVNRQKGGHFGVGPSIPEKSCARIGKGEKKERGFFLERANESGGKGKEVPPSPGEKGNGIRHGSL